MPDSSRDAGVEVVAERHRWFHILPNLVDDLDISVHAHRLYCHLKRVAGEGGRCYQSAEELARRCRMSTGSVHNGKRELVAQGLIELRKTTTRMGQGRDQISIVDIWARNYAATTSGSESPHDPLGESPDETPSRESRDDQHHHVMTAEDHHMTTKEEPSKEEPSEEEKRVSPDFLAATWDRVKEAVRLQTDQTGYTWIADTRLVRLTASEALVWCPTANHVAMLKARFSRMIAEAMSGEGWAGAGVEFRPAESWKKPPVPAPRNVVTPPPVPPSMDLPAIWARACEELRKDKVVWPVVKKLRLREIQTDGDGGRRALLVGPERVDQLFSLSVAVALQQATGTQGFSVRFLTI